VNIEALIEKAYRVFSDFEKPKQCTNYLDFEDAEFNLVLLSATRRSLDVEQLGTVGWGAIPCMNPEALAFFMPRLIELAVNGAIDKDGDAFYCQFINAFYVGAKNNKFRLFRKDQREAMADTFEFLYQNYKEQLTDEGWLDEALKATIEWSNT
jgi:hypothetical protein